MLNLPILCFVVANDAIQVLECLDLTYLVTNLWHTNKNVSLRDQPISLNIICKSKKPGRLVGMNFLLLHRISPRLMNINEFRTDQDYSSVSVQIPGLIW